MKNGLDAEANADADKKKLEAIETRNADSIIHSTERVSRNMDQKSPKRQRKNRKVLESLKETFKDEKADIKILKEKTDTLFKIP